MLTVTVKSDARGALDFLVTMEGKLRNPRNLNAALAETLERKLRAHFAGRQDEPNRLGAPKSGFWAEVRRGTIVGEVTDEGATVQVGVDTNFRIHLLGGTVKPKRGRYLTIPLVKEAYRKTVSTYEKDNKRKLFRIPGLNVLLERSMKTGDRSMIRPERASMLTKGGNRVFQMGSGVRVRPVYALATQAVIKPDPKAIPPASELAAALQETANSWLARQARKKGNGA